MGDDLETLRVELEENAKRRGADLFGVADLTPALDFVCKQGGEFLRRFPRAISIGMRLLDAVVDQLRLHENLSAIFTYQFHVYQAVNPLLNEIALGVSKRLQEEGYLAYPIPASQTINTQRLEGVISHKLAAHLAGLGWIGKSCLLVTPKYGPRVRFSTVLTDAPLTSGSPMPNGCGTCEECVKICPPKAFTGVPFDPSQLREARFNAHLCSQYLKQRRETLAPQSSDDLICGLCVYVCPHGRKQR